MTSVWEGDQFPVSWRVTSTEGVVDLDGADLELTATPLSGGPAVALECTAVGDVVTHVLTGTLAVGFYGVVLGVTRDGKRVTYPDAKAGSLPLTVKDRP
ncbi:hypothetical protein ACFQHV_00910 [Promicromonospora thailandica]|uniref:Uncharacterized protein n=1 Tax=Promicromonospora thailandica TaxID=765201 RepID=A0A9X2GAF8_9MICO|nr:hypothetical protein [Promicromonospora thailandica]MCP2265586.1 hypothetical protein [Promicromonospora thailandica]BFF17147.1 hypothetical protein GCM10025730_06680 [Promicromonospora thailandica]